MYIYWFFNTKHFYFPAEKKIETQNYKVHKIEESNKKKPNVNMGFLKI